MSEQQSIRDELARTIYVSDYPGEPDRVEWEDLTQGMRNEYLMNADGVLASPVLRRIQAEAEERAYRHAADVVHSEARWQWERSKGHVPGAQIVAQRMQVIEASLKGFADRIEKDE